jgi:hypothetical protein
MKTANLWKIELQGETSEKSIREIQADALMAAAKLLRRAECEELTPGSIRLAWSKRIEAEAYALLRIE